VRVCSLEDVASLSPQDFDAHAVVVATVQSFRVEDAEQRNVYAFSDAFEPHFRGVPPAALLALHDLPDALVTQADADSAKAGREMLAQLDSDPVNGFWLPTSAGRFYPDFVSELGDGRVFVAEYKGEHLRAAPKELQKGQVGQVWAERSASSAVFAMLYKQERGMNLTQQIDAAMARPAPQGQRPRDG
jgi:hypothetical protein